VSVTYVLGKSGNPLMPTTRGGRVRHLLKSGKAKVVSMRPFTIQLLYDCPEIVQPLFGGTNPGRNNIGEAVVAEDGTAVFQALVETRNEDIPKLMEKRAAHRRASRQGERKRRQRRAKKNGTVFPNRETKGRILPGCREPIFNHWIKNTEARFSNRKRPKSWLTPTATQLLRTHLNMVDKIRRILPVRDWSLE